jgi:hypothetical protein
MMAPSSILAVPGMTTLNPPDTNAPVRAGFDPWQCLRALPPEQVIPALPESLADLVECLPVAAVLSLIEQFGGTALRVPLPDNLTEDHELVKAIGAVDARRFCGICGSVEITFPKGIALEKLARTYQIRYLRHQEKWDVSKLARYFGVTVRTIYNALSSDE